jgi:hypothetical protein
VRQPILIGANKKEQATVRHERLCVIKSVKISQRDEFLMEEWQLSSSLITSSNSASEILSYSIFDEIQIHGP